MTTRFAFATCVQLGLSCIEEIYRMGHKLDLLITLHDTKDRAKSGRVCLESAAAKFSVPLIKTSNINRQSVIETIKQSGIDWLFIIGWSQIAKEDLLNAPKWGCIGMHPTLLPEGRGRASIPWAILKGLKETGVTLFKIDAGVDSGPIIAQKTIPLDSDENASSLYGKVVQAHVELIRDSYEDILTCQFDASPQDASAATTWDARRPEDGEITPVMTMLEADRMVRAVTKPYPGAFLRKVDGTLRIWRASTTPSWVEGAIKLADGYLRPVDFNFEEFER